MLSGKNDRCLLLTAVTQVLVEHSDGTVTDVSTGFCFVNLKVYYKQCLRLAINARCSLVNCIYR